VKAIRLARSAALFAAMSPMVAVAQEAADGRAAAILNQVEALATPSDIGSRRAAIVARLEQIGLTPRLVWFDPPVSARVSRRGANVVADIGGASRDVLLLGAHYDHVDLAQGVIDNAAGVAAVLQLAEAFAKNPLTNFTVRVALFDLEEKGLLGSMAMVRDSARTPLPRKFLNFDVFGYGNAYWVGAIDGAAALPSALREAGMGAGWRVVVDSLYPPSDHLSFRGTSTSSYAISILDEAEIDGLLERFRARDMNAGGAPPRIFQILHTEADTLDKLDAMAVARALDSVERAIRRLDATFER
jgi:aminopeptidase S